VDGFQRHADARVIALGAKSGRVIWDVEGGDRAAGEYFTAAPVA